MRIDLHVHTKASDGLYPPAEIVRMAGRAGLSVIGIADHDTVDGLDESLAAAVENAVRIIPAVEINSYDGGSEYHILGYFIRHGDGELRRTLSILREARIARMHVIIRKLAALGIAVTAEEILSVAGSGTVGRPHIAQALVKNGYAASVRDAFDRHIGEGKPAYAPRSKLTPREAIAIIRGAGGVPVLAHPGLWGGEELIPRLAEWGLAGIEAYSPDHTPEQVRRYLDITRSLGLVATGGSDFHGWGDPARIGLGAVTTPPEEFARLEELAKNAAK
jgi:predicted metal-dependent phosphoesterase TrpH